MKALVFKELREVLGIALAALGCYAALVLNLMGAKVFDWVPGMPRGEDVPFFDGFLTFFGLISVVFAVALGFRQSAWELSRGTYLFLLHLPRSRNAVFLTKLATGAAVLVLCASLPIVAYASWAIVPGRHAGPFEWSMTGPSWQHIGLVLLLYLGAFLSGLRPARWFGTRLLPLVACLALLVLLYWVPWPLGGLTLLTLAYAGLVSNVCFVARVRDYS
jgi:ABC-type transport system involved in multi-copper enzyme maturation permease subunit